MTGKLLHRRIVAVVCAVMILATSVVLARDGVSAQAPGAPPGQDLVITPGDLDFVLRQIAISEAHARKAIVNPNASPLCSASATFDDSLHGQTWYEPNGDPCVGSPLLPFGLRTVDGRWNNLQPGQTTYGAASQVFPRLLEPEFRAAEPVPPMAPSIPGQPTETTYEQTFGYVYDSQPRIISNLIVDQTTDNPAAVETLLEFLADGLDAQVLNEDGEAETIPPDATAEWIAQEYPGQRIFLQNVATDEGLSAPFSSWMTIFGQFFDHGLDLVEKGGNGTVVVPLTPEDPLYNHPDIDPNARFLMLTRATIQPGEGREHKNRTTPFIDQNQTYTSHPSHQVFLREYRLEGGLPVPTGALLDGADGGIPTWADIKRQAREVLGIDLRDQDVVDVPLLVTDPYGRFVPGPDGFPQIATEGGLISGTPDEPASTVDAISANHAFLDDIAHDAVPFDTRGNELIRGLRDAEDVLPAGQYDGDLLDAHYVTGDGRGNENIALTASHHVFHSEHNRLLGQIEDVIEFDATNDRSFGLAEQFAADGFWDEPERMFQAARFFNEMQYQHLAVEEFLRTVAPTMDVQPLNESAYHSELNAAITAEFAHVVYRFGHSMLTETLPRVYEDGTREDLALLDGFLNPSEFTKGGTLTPDEAAGSLILGLAGQVGNGIDEYVTDTLRNNLLGLPLDLATINLARARDTGIPSLQSARAQFYAATLDPTLRPYANWEDFRLEMKHPASVVNFIAAYGKHPTLADATTNEAKRDAAALLVQDAEFMTMDPELSGLNDVDFWVGGLAERTMVFGGMLGSSFNFVFESQAELLQNADRFYYLTRTQGLNFLAQLEANSFTELIQRNTSIGAVPLDVFAFPEHTFYLSELIGTDPATWPEGVTELDGTIRYDGDAHIVFYGTDGDDRIRGGNGDDTIWGRSGRDIIEGGDGADALVGGDGDDLITDIFGDDTIMGGAGNDAIRSGPGADLVLSGSGSDFVMMTRDDAKDSFNGIGNDFILGGTGSDRIWAGDDDDWLEGGQGHDLLQGDNALVYQNDPNGGHDVIIGGPGNNDLDSDGGDDIMVAGPGLDRAEGMLGFDWVTYKGHSLPVIADMRFTGLMPPDLQALRDRFDLVEGLSGWNGNDILRGLTGIDDIVEGGEGHKLTNAHLDRVAGLRALLQPGSHHANYACRFMDPVDCGLPPVDSDGISNIILGGGGSDLIEGRAGDDFIDGDVWLDVYIEWVNPGGPNEQFQSMVEFGDRVISGEINPGDLHIRRVIADAPDGDTGVDTAVYASAAEQYVFTYLGDGYWEVAHLGADELEEGEGRDVIRNIEQVQFADECYVLNSNLAPEIIAAHGFARCSGVGSIELSTDSPVEDQALSATVTIDGVDNPTDLIWEWQFGEAGEEFEPSPNPNEVSNGGLTSTFTPRDAEPGNHLRAIVSFLDDDGVRRTIMSAPTLNPVENINDAPSGPVIVPASPAANDILTATNLVDDDGTESIIEDQIVTYRWQANSGAGATDWTDIGTTGQPMFRVLDEHIGSQIRVIAEYEDDHGAAEQATSAPTDPVAPPVANNPATGTPLLTTSAPMVGEDIVVTTALIGDPDGITTDLVGNPYFTYQWQSFSNGNWVDIEGATGLHYIPTEDVVGENLRVVVRFTDTRGFVETLISAETADVLPAVVPVPAPVIATVNPMQGSPGEVVTITGTGLNGVSVTFNGQAATLLGVNPEGTLLTAVVPTGATSGAISVVSDGGAASTGTFTVLEEEEPPPTTTTPPTTTPPTTPTTPTTPNGSGYWMVQADGVVHAFGGAAHMGNAAVGSATAEDIEPTPSGNGYWVVSSSGVVFNFGDAPHFGNAGNGGALKAGERVTGIASTANGQGYWLFTSTGRVINFGNAQHFGDMSAVPLNGPVLDAIPTPSGLGYYMVGSDGGVFAFGDAQFAGSMGGIPLNAPVQSLVPDGDGQGYWLVASDGGVFAFDAAFYGSMGATPLNKPVTGMVAFGSAGYLMVAEDGGTFAFGSAQFHGSLANQTLSKPITSIAIKAA